MDSLEWYKYYRTNEYGIKSDDMKLAAVDHMIKTIIDEIRTGSVAIENSPFIMEIKNIFERKAELNYVNWARQAVDLMDAALIISSVWEILQDPEYNVRLRRPDCRSWVFGLNHRIMDQQQKNLEGILQRNLSNFKNWVREQNKPKPKPEPVQATTPPAATAAATAAYKGGAVAPSNVNDDVGLPSRSVTTAGAVASVPVTSSSPTSVAPVPSRGASSPAAAAPHRHLPSSAAAVPHRAASASSPAAAAPHRHIPPNRSAAVAPAEDEFDGDTDFPADELPAPNAAPTTAAAAPHRHMPANRPGNSAAVAPHRPAGRTGTAGAVNRPGAAGVVNRPGVSGANTAQRQGVRSQTAAAPQATAHRHMPPNRPGAVGAAPAIRGNQVAPQAGASNNVNKTPRPGASTSSGQDAVTRLANMQAELGDILLQLQGGKENQFRQVAMGQIELYNRIARVYDQHLSLAENSNNPDYLDAVNAQKEYMDFIVDRLSDMGVGKISSRPGTPFDDRYHEAATSVSTIPRGAKIKRSLSPGFKNGDSVWLREKVEV